MIDDNANIPGPNDPQIPEPGQPSAADLDAAAEEQEAAEQTSAASYAELQANVEGTKPPANKEKPPAPPATKEKPQKAAPPSLTHHPACGVVGKTGKHGNFGSNDINYVGPHRPETMKKAE